MSVIKSRTTIDRLYSDVSYTIVESTGNWGPVLVPRYFPEWLRVVPQGRSILSQVCLLTFQYLLPLLHAKK